MANNIYFELNENFEKIIKNALEGKKINKLQQITTGWTNIVYEVEAEDGNYFFRFPRDEFWSRTIVKDCEFAKYIHNKTGFNTANLELKYDNGRPFSMHRKIEGVPLASKMENMTQEQVETASRDIAKFMYNLHATQFDKEKVFSKTQMGTNLPDFLNELLTVHVSKKDREFWNRDEINDKCNNLVHGDFNSSNILIDENCHVSAIIDFGFGGFGDKYDDISRIIGRCPEKFKEPIIKNYENFSKEQVDPAMLENKIEKWTNIDNGYINYMKSCGIIENN